MQRTREFPLWVYILMLGIVFPIMLIGGLLLFDAVDIRAQYNEQQSRCFQIEKDFHKC